MPFKGIICSGVQISPHCQEVYEEMKKKKNLSFIVYKITNNDTVIEIDRIGKRGQSYDDFVSTLVQAAEAGEGRYAVYDCDYKKSKTSKLVFITWVNDSKVGVRQRMLYSASKKALQAELSGIAADMQCNDLEDLSWCRLVESCSSKYD